jgi:hypothetical protein
MTTTTERQTMPRNRAAAWVLYIVDAGLLVASGIIHVHLWDVAYRHVATLGPLFLVQAVAMFVIAIGILATRHVLAVIAGIGLAAGTILGFILARTVGIFGFKLPFSSGLANTVLIIEIVAVVLLAVTAALILRRQGWSALTARPGR